MPVTVAGGLALVRQPGVLAYLGPVCAYPTGLLFWVSVSLDPQRLGDRGAGFDAGTRERPPWAPRVQVRFDGMVVDSATRPTGRAAAGMAVLRSCGWRASGAASPDARHDSLWWVAPLPREGPVEFAVFLDGVTEHSGTARIDAGLIVDAARRAMSLWDQPGTGRR